MVVDAARRPADFLGHSDGLPLGEGPWAADRRACRRARMTELATQDGGRAGRRVEGGPKDQHSRKAGALSA